MHHKHVLKNVGKTAVE